MDAPVLLSVEETPEGQVKFTWEPYAQPDMFGVHGSVQGFDEVTGHHVIGAFAYGEQLVQGFITVPLDHTRGHATVRCELDVSGYTNSSWTDYAFAKSNVVELVITPGKK